MPASESASLSSEGHRTFEEIKAWLLSHFAEMLNLAPEAVDVRRPFSEFNLDSLEMLNLTMELEDWLGREIKATFAWDYASIESLARELEAGRNSA